MSPLARFLAAVIWVYQKSISPLFPGHCRYHPTCSEYALKAIRTHGATRGGWMGLKRIGRCHPWHEGGLDPVPERRGA